MAAEAAAIPVINMKSLVFEETKDFELQKLHSTCKEWGIFQLINHGVSSSLLEKLKHEIEEFFKLPLAEKMRFGIKADDFEGYGPRKDAQSGEDHKVDWAERFYLITNPIHKRKPHLFPQLPSSLRETLEVYISELQKITLILVGLMAEGLGIEKRDLVEELFEGDGGMQSLRMTLYPPCPNPDQEMGFNPHSDGSLLTILRQLNGVGGLQVKKDGVWIPVNFLPDAFVVNLGDILEMVSNGIYKSCEHRVTVNSLEERTSMAMFFSPKYEADIGPSPRLITQENPQKFKRATMEDYVNYFFSRNLEGKSNLDQFRV